MVKEFVAHELVNEKLKFIRNFCYTVWQDSLCSKDGVSMGDIIDKSLYKSIKSVLEDARKKAYTSVIFKRILEKDLIK